MGNMAQQQIQLQRAYEPIQKVKEVKEVKAVKETIESTEVAWKPDQWDKMYVWMRSWVPGELMPIILIAGVYAVFHVPINRGLTHIFGFNFDDLKEVVRRRKERDRELRKEKK